MSKIYFASDMHLGFPRREESLPREKKVVRWLDSIIDDADELYLLGDVFDFWFEYKHVVPRGFTRFLGKLAEFNDRGIPIHFFTGNHDVWVFDYLPKEIGVKVYRKPIMREIDGTKFFIGHGDGLGSGDAGFKLLKSMFTSKTLQWLFARIHPNSAVGFGHRWSNHSRYSKGIEAGNFNPEGEHLVKFIKSQQEKQQNDVYVFGHRHVPIHHSFDGTLYVNLGDWLTHFSYGEWDGQKMHLKYFEK
jgi:UDP-2,3-diacylglucosamine hydrolase